MLPAECYFYNKRTCNFYRIASRSLFYIYLEKVDDPLIEKSLLQPVNDSLIGYLWPIWVKLVWDGTPYNMFAFLCLRERMKKTANLEKTLLFFAFNTQLLWKLTLIYAGWKYLVNIIENWTLNTVKPHPHWGLFQCLDLAVTLKFPLC